MLIIIKQRQDLNENIKGGGGDGDTLAVAVVVVGQEKEESG